MSEQVWYLFQNGQQTGPFETEHVKQLYLTNMIAKDGYIFKVGWKDWRPVEECYEALGLPAPAQAVGMNQAALDKRRHTAPRASISGRVVVHNNGQLTIGQGVNVSVAGIFVETSEQLFKEGETLKLSIRCDGLKQAFNAEAKVIRFNADKRYPIGYGMAFTKIDPQTQSKIQDLVNEAGGRGDRGQFAARS